MRSVIRTIYPNRGTPFTITHALDDEKDVKPYAPCIIDFKDSELMYITDYIGDSKQNYIKFIQELNFNKDFDELINK